MNDRAHWLSLFSAVMHLTIGLGDLFRIGPRFLPPSWVVVYKFVPGGEYLYPGLFVLTGLLAAIGVRKPFALRLAFRLSALAFAIWGVAGIPAWFSGGGGNLQGLSANLYFAGCAWVLAHYVTVGQRSNEIDKQVAHH